MMVPHPIREQGNFFKFYFKITYWNYLYVQINYVYWLTPVMQSKNLNKIDNITHKMSEKDHKRFQ